MKRGKISKRTSVPITIWLPEAMTSALETALQIEDTDRSKFVRNSIRDRLARLTSCPKCKGN